MPKGSRQLEVAERHFADLGPYRKVAITRLPEIRKVCVYVLAPSVVLMPHRPMYLRTVLYPRVHIC